MSPESIEELRSRAGRDGEIARGLAETADEYATALGHSELPSQRAVAEAGALDPDGYSHDEVGNRRFIADYQALRREYLTARVGELGQAFERRDRARDDARLGLERFAGGRERPRVSEAESAANAAAAAERTRVARRAAARAARHVRERAPRIAAATRRERMMRPGIG